MNPGEHWEDGEEERRRAPPLVGRESEAYQTLLRHLVLAKRGGGDSDDWRYVAPTATPIYAPDEALWSAIVADDPAELDRCLAAGAALNGGRCTGGRTPLMTAIECGKMDLVALLLAAGAAPEAPHSGPGERVEGGGDKPVSCVCRRAASLNRQAALTRGRTATAHPMGARRSWWRRRLAACQPCDCCSIGRLWPVHSTSAISLAAWHCTMQRKRRSPPQRVRCLKQAATRR
jgi:hypothetical protein